MKKSQFEFSELMGYQGKVAISNIERGHMEPRLDAVVRLALASGSSIEWILTGVTSKKAENIGVREMSPEYAARAGIEVPLAGQMPAGAGVELMDEEPSGASLWLPFKDCKGAAAFTIVGDSMEDLYRDGDMVIIKPRPAHQPIHEGHTYCLDYEIDGRLYRAVKNLYKDKDGYRLRSKNGKYRDILVKDVVRIYRIVREIRGFTERLA